MQSSSLLALAPSLANASLRLNLPEEEDARMLQPPFSFDQIMAPLGAERFFAEYDGPRPLHL
jgi:hypothetical protein